VLCCELAVSLSIITLRVFNTLDCHDACVRLNGQHGVYSTTSREVVWYGTTIQYNTYPSSTVLLVSSCLASSHLMQMYNTL
jgi:hypothetical protein